MISYLCKLARVSRSGYYAWLYAGPLRTKRNDNDKKDYELIKQVFDAKQGKAGALTIKMILEYKYYVIMNHKKIRRIMRKFNLVTRIRRARPYKKMAEALQEHKTCPNVLKRNFAQGTPGKVLLTDITYLYYGSGRPAYLSCVKDGATREILAYHVSATLRMDLVYRTLDKLTDGGILLHPNAILHSDQGNHYTHPQFREKVKELGLIQSMSRKGNCWDNAPMESFFGHLKDELDYSNCKTIEELNRKIDNYMEEYNNDRYQWSLKRMTPAQFRNFLLAA